MLVLSRKPEQRIFMNLPAGGRITLAVVAVRGDVVHLGFEAPADVEINREEVQARIDRGEPRPR